jgi:hypothetical protein
VQIGDQSFFESICKNSYQTWNYQSDCWYDFPIASQQCLIQSLQIKDAGNFPGFVADHFEGYSWHRNGVFLP